MPNGSSRDRVGLASSLTSHVAMIDLHTHSTVSDGTETPAAVVRLALDAGCEGLAITDHDTLDHLPAATAAAEAADLHLVPGCEISCATQAPGSLHVLVYFVDATSPLARRLGALQAARGDRNERIVDALRAHGIDVTLEEILTEAGDASSVGRPHVARVLVRKGVAGSMQEAFDRWLAKGRPAYAERERLTPEEAVSLARASGAVTSLAHPYSLDLTPSALDEEVARLADIGLDAMECIYGRYSPGERRELRELAARHGLAVTGGSDYHGDNNPDLAVGVGRGDLEVPEELLERLEELRPSAPI